MEFSLILGSKIAMMMLWAVAGYVLVKTGIMKSSESKTLSTLMVYIITPCMIIHAFQIDLTPERVGGLVGALVFSAAAQLVFILITMLIRKPLNLTRIDEATLIYSNCGNLILPLVAMILGDEYTFYVAAYMATFNLLLWTHGVMLLRGRENVSVRKLFLNPNIIAAVAGLLLMFAHIRLPEIIDGAMAGLSDMIGPASMLVIGMVIAEKDIVAAFRFVRAYPIVLGRLVVYPVIVMLLLFATGLTRKYPFLTPVLQVSMLSAAAPPASFVSQLAVVYDIEPFKAGAYNIVGTIFCIITMPLIIFMYQLMF